MAEMMFDEGAPVPKKAIEYLEKKLPAQSFSYKDIWAEEHAQAFTVAKAMQMDVLTTIKESVNEAIRKGTSLKDFTKTLQPTLEQKGWWGKKDMVDPKTGEVKTAQLGSARRLKTIYRVNMRSAYNAGRYQQAMASELHPYLMFKVGPVRTKHRDEHLAWHGTVLPKEDEWWDSHLPPLGYGCNCTIEPVSRTGLKRLEQEGVGDPVQRDIDGGVRRMVKITTTRPKTTMKTFVNNRTGAVRKVPHGVTPGFEHNQGKYGRSVELANMLIQKAYENEVLGKADARGRVLRQCFEHPTMREGYRAFVRNILSNGKERGKMYSVGLLPDDYIKVMEKSGKSRKIKTGLIIMHDKLLTTKQAKHKDDVDAGIRKKGGHLIDIDWLNIPDYIAQPDRVYHDRKNNSLNLLKDTERGILMLPIRINDKVDDVRGDFLTSAYYVNKTFDDFDGQDRYERIK